MLYNYLKSFVCDSVHPKTGLKSGYCHPALVPNVEHRTHSVIDVKVKGYYEGIIIMPNEILLVLPRHLLITDVDAILDGFVFTKLLGAQHQHDMITSTIENVQKLWPSDDDLLRREDCIRDNDYRTTASMTSTFNHVDMGAYLAAYLARRVKLATTGWFDIEKNQLVYGMFANETETPMNLLSSKMSDPLLPFFKM